jgi:hypothetical protein
MSLVHTTTTLWRANKDVALTGHRLHGQNPSPVSAGFTAPAMPTNVRFAPIALAASIARTVTLRDAPTEMLARWADSKLLEVEWLIADGMDFALSPSINSLADAARTEFAGCVGAGMTDILMNALGYVWRDNAASVSGSLDPHADFIYGDGQVANHGVVLAEAHGSFAASVSAARIISEASRKYLRQVKPQVTRMSSHGQVVHGYSIAFGSKPGTTGAFLGVAETRIKKPSRKPMTPAGPAQATIPGLVPTSLALATHRSNFTLREAFRIVSWIDWVRGVAGPPADTTPVGFFQIPYAGQLFLACADFVWPFEGLPFWLDELMYHRRWWRRLPEGQLMRRLSEGGSVGLFVMEQSAAERFLNGLSKIIIGVRQPVIELPGVDPVGLTSTRDEDRGLVRDTAYSYALFRDGLALLGSPPPKRLTGIRVWSPKDGMLAN